ncbi:MAG TPA: hypothetical protein VIK32_16260 [Candidatus Limnocylindrales bacterium]
MSYLLEADLVDDCRRAATALQVVFEVAGQRVAKASGSSKGLPDAFLCVSGWHHPLELKRPASKGAEAGRFSLDQLVAAERRRAQGVETYAPRALEQFVALVNWSRRHRDGVCPGCPVVPEFAGSRCA